MISILLAILHGLYEFKFVRFLMWTNPLDFIWDVLMKFGSRILHGLSWFDLRCVLLDIFLRLCLFESYVGLSWERIWFWYLLAKVAYSRGAKAYLHEYFVVNINVACYTFLISYTLPVSIIDLYWFSFIIIVTFTRIW